MIKKKLIGMTSVVLASTLLLSGCANLAEKALEETLKNQIEKELEKQGVGKTDVDIKDGGIVIETDEGKAQFGPGSSLPADFPDAIPLPDQGTVALAFESAEGWMVSFGNFPDSAAKPYVDRLLADGWKRESLHQDVTGMYVKGDYGIIVSWIEGSDSLSIVVNQKK